MLRGVDSRGDLVKVFLDLGKAFLPPDQEIATEIRRTVLASVQAAREMTVTVASPASTGQGRAGERGRGGRPSGPHASLARLDVNGDGRRPTAPRRPYKAHLLSEQGYERGRAVKTTARVPSALP
ncbi:hypothetical protein AB0I77_50170 [Streptomyces sp. NPDC050619]|uniref:hypothetical protein n=1 Tax=Streptomyces sp. NPDC050619 TaxID=3157214 RepID=UPI003448A653